MQPLWFIPIAAVLVLVSKAPVVVAMSQEGQGYDNHHPRTQQGRLAGWGKRALAAHLNTIESFPIFSACLLSGHALGVSADRLLICCALFLVGRLGYLYLYIADKALFRSLIWTAAYFSCLAMPLLGLI
jgi:uncharacterized MAPEG superfamily protein